MKKCSILKICFIAALISFVIASNTKAFMFPPTPITPTLDVAGDAAGATKGIGDSAISAPMEKAQNVVNNARAKIMNLKERVDNFKENVKEKITDVVDNVKDKVEGAIEKVKSGINKFVGALHKKEKGASAVASSRKIEESKIVDISSEDSIVEGFEVLFGKYPQEIIEKYPNDKEGVKKKYRDKAVEFSNDAMIELYIATRDLENRMDAIEEDISSMSKKYVLGETSGEAEIGGEAAEANDELGSWTNYYAVSSTYDSILRITEELSALEAQYEAAQAIRGGILPEEETEEETEDAGDKTSSNSYFELSRTSSYAQIGEFFKQNIKGKLKDKIDSKNKNWELIETKPRVAKSPFEGAEDNFDEGLLVSDLTLKLNKALEAHNLKQQLDNFKGTFVEYHRMKELHQKSIAQLYASEKCVMAHLGRYYNNPEVAWIGKGCKYIINENEYSVYCDRNMAVTDENLDHIVSGYMLCEDDKTKICTKAGLNSYENRSGLSGYAIGSYKEAKALLALEVADDSESGDATADSENSGRTFAADDFVIQLNNSIDVKNAADLTDDVEVSSSQKDMEEMEKQEADIVDNNTANDRSMVKPSKELEFEQLDRERDVLGWQIGSEVAKKVGEGMSRGSSDEYGSFKRKYDLWEDEKYFYDQYLDLKYKNMGVFVNNMDLREISIAIAEKINSSIFGIQPPPPECDEDDEEDECVQDTNKYVHGVEVNELKSYITSGINNLKNAISVSEETDPIYALQAQLESNINTQRANFLAAEQAAQNKIKTAYEQLDKFNVNLNNAKKAYNDKVEEYIQHKGSIDAEDTMLGISTDRQKWVETKDGEQMNGFADSARKNKKEAEDKAKTAASELKGLKAEIDSARNGIDVWEAQLEQAKKELEDTKNKYAALIASLQQQKEQQLQSSFEQIEGKVVKTLSDNVSSVATTKGRIFSTVISIADSAALQVKQNAISAINRGYTDITALGDDKYNPDKHNQILSIHTSVMDDIKSPKLNLSAGMLSGYLTISTIETAAKKAVAEALFEKICPSNSCYAASTDYFVGLAPQEKDFAAPNKLNRSYTPPVREIVHFDGIDYETLAINKQTGAMPYESLLDYGYEMPAIWETILGDRGFVDRHVSVASLLEDKENIPPAADYRARGGLYPCVSGYLVDMIGGISLTPKEEGAAICHHIEKIDVNQLLGTYRIKIKLKDESDDFIVKTDSLGSSAPKISELKMFANNGDTGMVFDSSYVETLKYLDKLKETTDKEDKYDVYEKHRADNSVFNKNQIGNFLGFVELEMEYQKTLNELDVKVQEARETLKGEFAKFDYVPPENFDLSDEKTYIEILVAIDNGKTKLFNEACPTVNSIKSSPKNDMIEEKIAVLDNVCKILKQDSDELVKLTDNMKPDKELEEIIKREKTDRAAQSEYDKEAEESHKKNLNEFVEPYCAVY